MACVLSFLFMKVTFIGFGVLLTLMLQWIPAVNPITTIFLVGPYRRKVFGMCRRRKWAVDALDSNAHSITNTGTRLATRLPPRTSNLAGRSTSSRALTFSGCQPDLSQI
ncbi:hypothetical protein AAVH_37917 [Aphelenchoides avenae]|nr:hypothetical protein AAVH_37917 [Aphelenchus avenae]